jgi:hypothetical protein
MSQTSAILIVAAPVAAAFILIGVELFSAWIDRRGEDRHREAAMADVARRAEHERPTFKRQVGGWSKP